MASCMVFNGGQFINYFPLYTQLKFHSSISHTFSYITFSMANFVQFLLFSLLIILSSKSSAQSSSSRTLVLPVAKDRTLQYTTHLTLGTPAAKVGLVVDLGGRHLWFDCLNSTSYKSSTLRQATCGTASCSVAKGDCIRRDNTCMIVPENSIFGPLLTAFVADDKVSIQSTDGSKAGPLVSVPNVIFGCSETFSLTSLADGTRGMLGLSRERVSVPSQFSSFLNARKFVLCLPSKVNTNGALFLGNSPYEFYPNYNTSQSIDMTSRFIYTKLHTNYARTATPRIQGPQLPEYFVKIMEILVNGKQVPINATLLEFQRTGVGGSKITTVKPYTTFESQIYRPFIKLFDEEIIRTWRVKKVAPVAPFSDCYTKGFTGMTLLGVTVPGISLVFENRITRWDIFGANSMVEINKDVMCLAIIDGGTSEHQSTYIDIGAHQLEDNLLQFDLGASKLGFTQSLRFEDVECSNFNF